MESLVRVNTEFWKKKRVLVTGHTGFKGSWLAFLLRKFGSDVTGLSLSPKGNPSLFESAQIGELCTNIELDITKLRNDLPTFADKQFDCVIHLAAEPLVRTSYARPVETFETNLMGTLRLLEMCRTIKDLKAIVVVTTDKVYRNIDDGRVFTEDDQLGGRDPYSSSKAAVELVVNCYRKSFFEGLGIGLSSCRAGNVVGGGDWGIDRLVPDAVRAWKSENLLEIRNPSAVRPWQFVLDVLFGYLAVAQAMFETPSASRAWNIGPQPQDARWTVLDIASELQTFLPGLEIGFDESDGRLHEARELALDSSNIREIIGHSSLLRVNEALEWTTSWYRDFFDGQPAHLLCDTQLARYAERYDAR